MPTPFLHTASGAYDLPAILRRAWIRARNAAARCAKLGDQTGPRAHFADALRQTWDEARSARANAAWRAQQDRAALAAEALDARTREIMGLKASLAAADGIDSTWAFLAERGAIVARLAAATSSGGGIISVRSLPERTSTTTLSSAVWPPNPARTVRM